MFRSILNDVRFQFQSGNTITRLIIVNVAVFLAITVFQLILRIAGGFDQVDGLFSHIVQYLFLSQDLMWDAKHPCAALVQS